MTEEERICKINIILNHYFANPLNPRIVKAKDMMDLFIEEGIFNKAYNKGLPIRNLLRSLDAKNELGKIPYVQAERKESNTYWFFVFNDKYKKSTSQPKTRAITTICPCSKKGREDSDEYYVIGLCNEVLGRKALQQYKFAFLLGDSGRRLPVDAYYEDLQLVVEYCEYQHTESVPLFDNRITVSGVSRGEQRKIYDYRRKTELPKHGIQVIQIHYTDFGNSKRLKRNYEKDIEIVRKRLSIYLS